MTSLLIATVTIYPVWWGEFWFMLASLAYLLIALTLKSSPGWTILLLMILFILFSVITDSSLCIHWPTLGDIHKIDQLADYIIKCLYLPCCLLLIIYMEHKYIIVYSVIPCTVSPDSLVTKLSIVLLLNPWYAAKVLVTDHDQCRCTLLTISLSKQG